MSPHKLDLEVDWFRTNDRVRLLGSHGKHPSGSLGRIVGRFAREDPTWVVSFSATEPCIEVRSDRITLLPAAR
jgi:hypothetical protein